MSPNVANQPQAIEATSNPGPAHDRLAHGPARPLPVPRPGRVGKAK
jgi:hypothetical protein